jgi:hypothetical protein
MKPAKVNRNVKNMMIKEFEHGEELWLIGFREKRENELN